MLCDFWPLCFVCRTQTIYDFCESKLKSEDLDEQTREKFEALKKLAQQLTEDLQVRN